MRQLISLFSLSALILLTACGGILASDNKSQASNATGTRTSASTNSAVTTATGTGTRTSVSTSSAVTKATDTSTQQVANNQFATLSMDASSLTPLVGLGTQLFVSIVPIDQNPADRRELIFALPASVPFSIVKLPVKSYKLSVRMSDPRVALESKSVVVAVTAGAVTNLVINVATPSCAPSGPCSEAILMITEPF